MSKRASIAANQLDVVTFIETTLVDPETGKFFVLTKTEKTFLRRAVELRSDGRLRYPELVFSAPKKTGKTTLAALALIYIICILGGQFAEGICCANDLEQSTGRVFQAISRIVEASPMLASDAIVNAGKITFRSTGSTIVAIASDYAGAAGANPTITVFDELWGYTSERSHRLWDEMVPPPTRKIACRLTTTYSGFEGESTLLEGLHRRGLKGKEIGPDLYEQPGMLMFWTHRHTAPWQTAEWREQMREQLRPNAYLRLIENRWVSSDSTFVDMEWWDRCVDTSVTPLLSDRALPVWCGVDASVKRDSTAIVACAYDNAEKKVRLVTHRIFQPSAADPLDFEATIEKTLLELRQRFRLREVRFDPYQMAAVSQRLLKADVPMIEFPQSVGNLTEASQNLFELVKASNLVAYPDAIMRLAVQRAVAIESTRGWRIAKEKSSHKIDVVVALAQAALGAVQGGIAQAPMIITEQVLARAKARRQPPQAIRIAAAAIFPFFGHDTTKGNAMFTPMKPMPSPLRTNRANLFIPSNFPSRENPRLAYDSANGLRDMPNDLTKTIERAGKYLRGCGLSDDDIERAKKLLAEMTPAASAEDAVTESISDEVISKVLAAVKEHLDPSIYSQVAEALSNVSESAVEPPATLAGDGFTERFPEALRIGGDTTARRKRAKPSDGAAFADFAERFPEAERLLVVP